MTNTVTIPSNVLPEDGRFGSGPTKIRPEQIQALDKGARNLLGTSHRQTPIKQVVGSIREGLSEFFQIPDGYEVVLGNGGASAFWDIACASLITRKAAFGTYGSFSSKFAKSAQSAPFLEEPEIFAGEPGTYRLPELTEYVDTYCWAHNETSTGVAAPIKRIAGTKEQGALTLIDATSGAGALPVDISQTDAYYFSPQKAFGSDGGLWIAVLSPAAIERAYGIAKSVDLPGARRWIPPFLSLTSAIENSRKDQTLNTPAVATLIMLENQVRWLNDNGGLAWASARCARSASLLYQWAEKSDYASRRKRQERALQRRGHHRYQRWHQCIPSGGGIARKRHCGHQRLPQARPQPAAHRRVPVRGTQRCGCAHPLYRLRGGTSLMQGKVWRYEDCSDY